ncbi:MAG: hypothetical protein RJA12_1204, partial [Planctomycetota bacterium]
MSHAAAIEARWCTPVGASAIAVLQLSGDAEALERAMDCDLPVPGATALHHAPGLDDALLLRVDERTLLVTPHGGPRLRQLWTERLLAHGARFTDASTIWNAA